MTHTQIAEAIKGAFIEFDDTAEGQALADRTHYRRVLYHELTKRGERRAQNAYSMVSPVFGLLEVQWIRIYDKMQIIMTHTQGGHSGCFVVTY